jgi:hypothetical protein
MALRSKKAIGALIAVLFCELIQAADRVTIPVRHPHLRKGGTGEIQVGESSILFREAGKKQKHSREWAFDDIQQLYVGSNSLRILTYEDVAWMLGKDREYEFDRLPEGAAHQILEAARGRIEERRLIAAIPQSVMKPVWQIKAKVLEGRSGSDGVVLAGEDSIVYKTEERDASRTWHFSQIDNISSSGPFDLTITTFERGGSRFAGRRDFRFQLKAPLPEERYNALWRRLNETRLTQFPMNTQTKENPNE